MAEKRTPQGLVVGLIPEEATQETPPAKKLAKGGKSGKGGKNKPSKTDETPADETPADETGEKQNEEDTPQDGEGE